MTDQWPSDGDECCPQLCIVFPVSSGKHRSTQNRVLELSSNHWETNLDCCSTARASFQILCCGKCWCGPRCEIMFRNCFATVARHYWICGATVSETVLSNSASSSGLGLTKGDYVVFCILLQLIYVNAEALTTRGQTKNV